MRVPFKFSILGILLIGFMAWGCRNLDEFPVSSNPIGSQIKKARKEKGVSQEELAYILGLSDLQIHSIEKGDAVPTRDLISVIEEKLEVDIILDNI